MKRLMVWLMVALMMGLVFYFSNESASSSREISVVITGKVLALANRLNPLLELDWNHLHHLIRKMAHFILYMVLGCLTFAAFIQNRKSVVYNISLTMMVCVLFAITDEIHQIFISGRSGEVRDVIIDGIGALCGIIAALVIKMFLDWVRVQLKLNR